MTAALPPPADLALEVRGLTKRFGSRPVIDEVDLAVPKGCAFGYVGPNGAGKTTLIRTVLGLLRPDAGTVRVLGHEMPSSSREALAKVGAIVDEPRFHGYLSGLANLELLAAARGGRTSDRIPGALDRVGLSARAGDKVSKYSMGMRQRLGIASCLLADPQLLILDEPMNGLDPAGMVELRRLVGGLVAEGRTVVLSSHLLDEVQRMCEYVAIVDQGHIVVQGRIEDLVAATGSSVRVGTNDPMRVEQLLTGLGGIHGIEAGPGFARIRLLEGYDPDAMARAINRHLVQSDVDVVSLWVERVSLEERFLALTARFGAQP
jgi:ABC-2 type transport system ATP-binding protein